MRCERDHQRQIAGRLRQIQLFVYGQDGNDVIQVDGDVKATAYLFGGLGNDVFLGGGGPSR
jgi:Ca2+-binding RTX toxin-like protein